MTVIMTPPSSASKTTKQLLFLYRIVKFLSVIRLIRSPISTWQPTASTDRHLRTLHPTLHTHHHRRKS